jgi:chaperonin GroES
MYIKPLYNRLVVRRKERPSQSQAGIFIVQNDTDDRTSLIPEGEVIAVGHDVHDVSVGNWVVFRKMSGTDVKVDGDDLLVMTEDDVIAVIE